MEGKIASQKLKVLNDQIETAKDQGLSVEHLEEWVIFINTVIFNFMASRLSFEFQKKSRA